ncbi:hypothetical protein SETIT_2G195000v2 [Setaria italica]|uniref:Uncharacterized protein n=1 Tax=Setaria italica TaxID=4555 RepID=A0A368Q178_SETIT|nr:hypothetical protein SETIT_2G195000v2 [Setaria italica]
MPDVTTNTEVLWNLKVLAVQSRCLVKCAATAADRCWKPCRRLLCQARQDYWETGPLNFFPCLPHLVFGTFKSLHLMSNFYSNSDILLIFTSHGKRRPSIPIIPISTTVINPKFQIHHC